ncbi:MAG: rRNA maturation RNase YbeY [Lachnospiraceae bacterium]|nr:rRNA maturation RNase YbeY [Lachnospiraceae bacterium]
MTFYVEPPPDNFSDPGFDREGIARAVAEAVLKKEGCPFEAQVSLTFVSPGEIRELNARERGVDRETDVLSFPMIDFPSPADYSCIEEGSPEFFDLDTGELLLGDIVLNMERVYTQAEEYGHSVKREFAFLIAHSMLHLLGFDHETKEDEMEMITHQEEVLVSLGIERERGSYEV